MYPLTDMPWFRTVTIALLGCALLTSGTNDDVPGAVGAPYPGMPQIAPIGARIARYMAVPESAQGPAIDAAKGYRLQKLGKVCS